MLSESLDACRTPRTASVHGNAAMAGRPNWSHGVATRQCVRSWRSTNALRHGWSAQTSPAWWSCSELLRTTAACERAELRALRHWGSKCSLDTVLSSQNCAGRGRDPGRGALAQ